MDHDMFVLLSRSGSILLIVLTVFYGGRWIRTRGFALAVECITQLRKELTDYIRSARHHADLTRRHPEMTFKRQC
jgi:hypothetical protein